MSEDESQEFILGFLTNHEGSHIIMQLSINDKEIMSDPIQQPENNNSHIPKTRNKLIKKKKHKNKQKYQQLTMNKNNGHWLLQQKKKYHLFLQIYHKHFQKKELRRVDKIFKVMADFIGTREADQCRSHHQKMEKRHQNFHKILYYLRQIHCKDKGILGMNQEIEKLYKKQYEIISQTKLNDMIRLSSNENDNENNQKLDDKSDIPFMNQLIDNNYKTEDYMEI